MSQFGSRARSLFDRMFPERQIYHRSGGTVRYVSLSPGKQALLALSAVGLAGCCVYATTNTLLEGPQLRPRTPKFDRERASRSLAERPRAQAAASQALLEGGPAVSIGPPLISRSLHEVLRSLIEYAGGASLQLAANRPIERDGARIIMAASSMKPSRAVARHRVRALPVHDGRIPRPRRGARGRSRTNPRRTRRHRGRTQRAVRGVLRITGVSMASLTDRTPRPPPAVRSCRRIRRLPSRQRAEPGLRRSRRSIRRARVTNRGDLNDIVGLDAARRTGRRRLPRNLRIRPRASIHSPAAPLLTLRPRHGCFDAPLSCHLPHCGFAGTRSVWLQPSKSTTVTASRTLTLTCATSRYNAW